MNKHHYGVFMAEIAVSLEMLRLRRSKSYRVSLATAFYLSAAVSKTALR